MLIRDSLKSKIVGLSQKENCRTLQKNHLHILTSILIKFGCIKRLDVTGMTYLLVTDDMDN